MASASIRFFMKNADAVMDADADQCKRTLTRGCQPLETDLSNKLQ